MEHILLYYNNIKRRCNTIKESQRDKVKHEEIQ